MRKYRKLSDACMEKWGWCVYEKDYWGPFRIILEGVVDDRFVARQKEMVAREARFPGFDVTRIKKIADILKSIPVTYFSVDSVNSYSLKHLIERAYKAEFNGYVSNGEVIYAAELAWIPWRRAGPGLNAIFPFNAEKTELAILRGALLKRLTRPLNPPNQ